MVFDRFWSESGYMFNHLGLKLGKVLYTTGIGIWNWVCFFLADTTFLMLFRSEIGWQNHLFWSEIG